MAGLREAVPSSGSAVISAVAGSALGGGGYDVIADGAELPRDRPPKLSHWAVLRFSP